MYWYVYVTPDSRDLVTFRTSHLAADLLRLQTMLSSVQFLAACAAYVRGQVYVYCFFVWGREGRVTSLYTSQSFGICPALPAQSVQFTLYLSRNTIFPGWCSAYCFYSIFPRMVHIWLVYLTLYLLLGAHLTRVLYYIFALQCTANPPAEVTFAQVDSLTSAVLRVAQICFRKSKVGGSAQHCSSLVILNWHWKHAHRVKMKPLEDHSTF